METGDANCDPDDEGASVAVVPPSVDNCEAAESSKEGDNNAAGDRSSGDAVAKGISSVLVSVIKDFDSRAQDTLKSQGHLSSSIDRLTSELDRLLEDAPLPFIMQHAARISSVRKRVSSMNAVLRSIQRRVDNIDRMLSTASPPGIHFFMLTECSYLFHNPLVPLVMLFILYRFQRSFVITMHVPRD